MPLDTALTDELVMEGLARELVNKLNTMRRDSGLDVTDRINVKIKSTDKVQSMYQYHQDYIRNEVLALSISFEDNIGTEWDLNGEPAKIELNKV